MDEKLKSVIGNTFSHLTEEQKDRFIAGRTAAELTSLLNEQGIALPDEALDTVAGGGAQQDRDLEFVLQLQKWDDVCQQRGIDWNDISGRDQVWKELYPNG